MIRIRYVPELTNRQYYDVGMLWCRDEEGLDWERITKAYWPTPSIVIFCTKEVDH
jgi:hypothetical protein